MDMDLQSNTMIESVIKKALKKYMVDNSGVQAITDLYFQPNPCSGELVISNDDEEILFSSTIEEWKGYSGENFYEMVERVLTGNLKKMYDSGFFDNVNLLKPYSFVLIGEDKETITELLLVDELETMLIYDGLLSGLDEELDSFLKNLLES